ncbi:MAG: FAD-binding oxidoreductase [Actinobacteria bacterium]|nr:FAD-binding oxidoreductase [Actinomycetota bacterium]
MARADGLRKLAEVVQGRVVFPSDLDYDRERLIWNARFETRPLGVVKVASSEDVRRVIGFARQHDVRVVARNGGHSFGGYSTGDGVIVVDVSRLTDVEVSEDRSRVHLGAGATVLPTYQALWPHKLAITAGTCPTVGITGLTAGGGLGVLGRLYGLTCDSLTHVEIVDADGELLHAGEDRNPDLFWALRGGGGGNFGVVVSQTFRLVPVDMPFTHSTIAFPWQRAARVVTAWQEWAHGVPGELWSALMLETQAPEAGPSALIEAVYAGDPARVGGFVDELAAAVGTAPSEVKSSTSEFVTVPTDFYCKGLRPEECHTEDLFPGGKLPRSAYYAKSDIATGPWPSAGIEALVAAVEERQRDPLLTPTDFDPHTDAGKILIEIADGAVGSVATDATAFPHRDALFVLQIASRWRKTGSQEVAAANMSWAGELYSEVEPYRSGSAYLGYIDPELEDWEQAYYGANLARLRQIKAQYDPDNFFRFARSIPPA